MLVLEAMVCGLKPWSLWWWAVRESNPGPPWWLAGDVPPRTVTEGQRACAPAYTQSLNQLCLTDGDIHASACEELHPILFFPTFMILCPPARMGPGDNANFTCPAALIILLVQRSSAEHKAEQIVGKRVTEADRINYSPCEAHQKKEDSTLI